MDYSNTWHCVACNRFLPLPMPETLWCAECVAKCSSCGGTGRIYVHPRLGLWLSCVCAKFEVRESRNGKGVFAKIEIEEDEIVWDWTREKIWKRSELPDPYPEERRFLQIGLDAYIGNASGPKEIDDYFNHSCKPNCKVIAIENKALLGALRDIQPGEELTFDYSVTMKGDSWTMACNCGVPGCRKVIRELKPGPPVL
jgi:hypothetical protein